jgi:hypothetical protein
VRVLAGLDGGIAVVVLKICGTKKTSGEIFRKAKRIAYVLSPFAPLACPFGVWSAPGHILKGGGGGWDNEVTGRGCFQRQNRDRHKSRAIEGLIIYVFLGM